MPWAGDFSVLLLSPLACWNYCSISSPRPMPSILGDLEKDSVPHRREGGDSHFNIFFRWKKKCLSLNIQHYWKECRDDLQSCLLESSTDILSFTPHTALVNTWTHVCSMTPVESHCVCCCVYSIPSIPTQPKYHSFSIEIV